MDDPTTSRGNPGGGRRSASLIADRNNHTRIWITGTGGGGTQVYSERDGEPCRSRAGVVRIGKRRRRQPGCALWFGRRSMACRSRVSLSGHDGGRVADGRPSSRL